MATQKIMPWICTFCDAEVSAAEKPTICPECEEKDSFEKLPEVKP